jgi:hypothetical protein
MGVVADVSRRHKGPATRVSSLHARRQLQAPCCLVRSQQPIRILNACLCESAFVSNSMLQRATCYTNSLHD